MGKLIVIEGLDGSGKSTQLELLGKNLSALGIDNRTVSFPDYNENSSALVKMYLGGEFGTKPGDVNAYAASLFYAVDRFASYKKHWQDYYLGGGVVISGRYVTSNAVHQTAKLPENEWEDYLSWLYALEYGKVGIPKPDLVIFLDMPPELSKKLLEKRYGGVEEKKDIHEKDITYQQNCRKAAMYNVEHAAWRVISCNDGERIRTVEEIAADVLKAAQEVL
ncbi:MAG: deoxynucleoside kinase [Clostridia bacterium]|nr:deoxynucleoside kinase [Clostridia bacterium]MBR3593513.1 deoxynucleoside kinase [Clostridia bacterium]